MGSRHPLRTLSNRVPLVIGGTLALGETMAFAQGAPSAAGRPLYVEWGIVAAMVGLVLFAVCRKSFRS